MKTTISKRAQELINYTRPQQTCLRALLIFAAQNPGFEWGNYETSNYKESLAAYRGDARPVAKQMKEIRSLAWRFESLTNEVLEAVAPQTFSGRLQFIFDRETKGVSVDYTTGQYWPTEYRLAALQMIKAALREADTMASKAVAA